MNRNLSLCGLVAVSLLLPACATVTRGTSEKFNIETTPTAANVSLSTGQTCVSPCQLKLKRKTEFTVTATKDGYQPATASVESKIKGGGVGAAAGNLLVGGLIGGIVDGSNGSMRDLTPNPLRLTLNPVSAAAVVGAAPASEAPAVPEEAAAPTSN